MTGVDGRPELVIEGSNNLETGWKEYHFVYKPGKLNEAPKFLSKLNNLIHLIVCS